MLVLVVRRSIALTVTLVVASAIIFLVMTALPGDPAAIILGVGAQEDTLAALRAELGLDRPLVVQYLDWAGGLLTGDLGRSHTYSVPVATLIGERLQVSLPLALMAMALTVAIAVPAGVIAAARHEKPTDAVVSGLAQVGVAIPNFWFAILLILVFAVWLKWVPAGGFAGWENGLWPGVRSLLVPAVALALPQAAILTRVARSATLDVIGEDYVRTARAKGLTRAHALWRHAVPNALIPVVTIMGLQFSFLVAGTIVIEQVFYLPGVGRLLFQAISQRDLVTVQSLVVLIAATVVTVNFLVDLAYLFLDPRLRRRAA